MSLWLCTWLCTRNVRMHACTRSPETNVGGHAEGDDTRRQISDRFLNVSEAWVDSALYML